MAGGPGGREVGRVSVRALPDTSSFARSLERYLQRVERTLRVNIPVELDNGDVAASEGILDELTRDRKVTIETDVDMSLVDRLEKSVNGLGSGSGSPTNLLGGLGKVLGVTGAIATLLPLVSTLILGLPGLVASIAAPFGAILLGLNGIRAAAETLVKPFVRMQGAISKVFERKLTPIFKQLKVIFDPLTKGMKQIARAISTQVGFIVDGLTSDKGLALIKDTFTNIASAMNILAPSLQPITEALLTLIDAGSKAFVEIAPALADMGTEFAKFIQWADDTGVLTDGFTFLGDIIIGTVALFLGLIAAGLLIAAAFVRVREEITEFLAPLSEVGPIVSTVIGWFRALPGRVVGALSSLGSGLLRAIGAAMGQFVDGVRTGTSKAVDFVKSIPGKILSALGDIGSLLFNAGASLISGFIDGIGSKIGDVKDKLGDLTGSLTSWKGPESLDRVILRDAGRSVIGGFIDGLEDRYADVQASLAGLTGNLAVPAMPGGSFLPKGSPGAAVPPGHRGAQFNIEKVVAPNLNVLLREMQTRARHAGIGGPPE